VEQALLRRDKKRRFFVQEQPDETVTFERTTNRTEGGENGGALRGGWIPGQEGPDGTVTDGTIVGFAKVAGSFYSVDER